jgi:hypothetical protein
MFFIIQTKCAVANILLYVGTEKFRVAVAKDAHALLKNQSSKYGVRAFHRSIKFFVAKYPKLMILQQLAIQYNDHRLADPQLLKNPIMIYIEGDQFMNVWDSAVQDDYSEFVNLFNHFSSNQ